jgi:hypothetical protein
VQAPRLFSARLVADGPINRSSKDDHSIQRQDARSAGHECEPPPASRWQCSRRRVRFRRPAQIEVDHNEIFHALRNEAFHASVLTMVLDGANQSVILKDTQWHPYKQQVLHLDFQRVDATHKIHVKVPLHFINADIAPGVKLEGGMVSHPLTELDLECLPGDLPEFIEVDLKDLKTGCLHPRFRPDPAEGCEGPDPR